MEEDMVWASKYYFSKIKNPFFGDGSKKGENEYTTSYSINKEKIKEVFKLYKMKYNMVKQEWVNNENQARWLGAHAEPITLFVKGDVKFLNDLHRVIKELGLLSDKSKCVEFTNLTKLDIKELEAKVEELRPNIDTSRNAMLSGAIANFKYEAESGKYSIDFINKWIELLKKDVRFLEDKQLLQYREKLLISNVINTRRGLLEINYVDEIMKARGLTNGEK